MASYVLTALQTKDFGATTELALLVTFGLGALAVRGFKTEAVAAAAIVTGLLGFKGELHRSLEHIDQQELRGTLQLLLIAAVILPLLDVDAVSLSLAQAANTDLPVSVAATGILLVVFVNTVVKALLATMIGGWGLARWCLPILLAAIGLGLVVALLTST